MYPFRIRCFQIIKCTRFNGDSVDREYLSVYQILHIEIIRWQTLTGVATIFSPLKIHSQTLTHYNTLFFIRKSKKEYNILCYSSFPSQTLCRIYIGFAVNAVNRQIYAFLIFIKKDSLSIALPQPYWIWQVTHNPYKSHNLRNNPIFDVLTANNQLFTFTASNKRKD